MSARRISVFSGSLTALIGIIGIIGWFFNLNLLTSFQQKYIPISPNTAFLFLLLGFFLTIQEYKKRRPELPVIILISAITIVIASLTIFEVVTGITTEINRVLFQSSILVGSYQAGDMSPITASCFLLFGYIIIAQYRGFYRLAGVATLMTGITGGIILIGYAFGTPLLYGGPYIPVSLPTGIGILLVSCGYITLSGNENWPLSEFTGDSTRALLLRSILPILVILLLLSEWLHHRISEKALINPALFSSIEVIISACTLILIISWISRIIGNQIDQTKQDLIESEEKYRIITESTSDVIWHLDLMLMRFSYVSPSVKPMRGFTPEEVMQSPFSASFTPESYQSAKQRIEKRLKNFKKSGATVSDPFTDLLDQPSKDRSVIHCEITSRIIYNSRTGQYGLIGVTRNVTDRVKYQKELEASEQRARAIFNSMFQLLGLLKPDGTALDINETALTFGGVTREEVIGKLFWDTGWWTFSPDTRNKLIDSVQKAGNGEFIRYETQVRGVNDQIITVDFSIKPVLNEDGIISLLISEGRDITERKKAEEKLTILAGLLEISPVGVLVHDNDGKIIFTNTSGCEYHGYTHEELLSRTLRDLTIPEEASKIKERMEQISENNVSSFIVHHYRKDNSIIPLEVFARRTKVRNQDLIINVTIDISDRLKQDEQIRRERDRAEQYLNIVEVMIMVLDHEGKIAQINRKGVEILGGVHEELIGSDWYERFIPKRHQVRGRESFARVMKGDIKPFSQFENIIHTASGEDKILQMRSVLISHDGEITGLLVSGEDITQRRELEYNNEKAIRQIQQNLAQLAILNDEIRNPLTVISCIAENETDEKTFRSLLTQIDRIDNLISGLDNRWSESQKVLSFLRKHYQISIRNRQRKGEQG